MRIEGIIRGDTDAPTTFSDLQHGATINLAQIAIQDELQDLASDIELPYEVARTGTITTVAGTADYALATDFVRFRGTPILYCLADNNELTEFPGGEDALKTQVYNYRTVQTNPGWWYFTKGTTKKVSFYPVPSTAKTYTYDYEKDASVTSSTDTLPFHNEIEAQAFCRLAARRFKFLFQGQDLAALSNDPERQLARATLVNLMVGKNPVQSYAPRYK